MSIGNHPDIKVLVNFIFPIIVLYGLYVQFNGSVGFGGGFQSGVIIASAFIVRCMVFGVNVTLKILSVKVVRLIGLIGILLYGFTGLVDLFFQHQFLSYNFGLGDFLLGQQIGIFCIELGVLSVVFSSMYLIYLSFVGVDS